MAQRSQEPGLPIRANVSYHTDWVSLLIQLLLGSILAMAQSGTVTVHGNVPVYKEPKLGAEALFYAVEGERLELLGGPNRGFRKVRSADDGGMNVGYVRIRDLQRSERRGPPLGRWGFGLGMTYTQLTQQREPFSTTDQVTYNPSPYKSKATAPFLAAQRRRDNFWRILLGQKKVAFRGTAKTDVAGSKDQDVKLDLTFWALAFEKAWNPWRKNPLYFGFNFEVAKATSQELSLNSVQLPTAELGLPYYVGLQGLVGANFFVHKRWSIYIEGRAGGIWNQSPAIYEGSAAAGMMYWP